MGALAWAISAMPCALMGCQSLGDPAESQGNAVAQGTTDAKAYRYVLTSEGPLSAGDHTMELQLFDAQNVAVDGLTLTVTPFMPAMGHGSPANPSVQPQGNGIYRLSSVMLEMSGYWVLNVTISGTVTDQVTIGFDVS